MIHLLATRFAGMGLLNWCVERVDNMRRMMTTTDREWTWTHTDRPSRRTHIHMNVDRNVYGSRCENE